MLLTRSKLVLVTVTLAGLNAALGFGCADVDPRYGPPQVIKGRQVEFGGAGDGGATTVIEAAPTTKTATELFADLYGTISDPAGAKGAACIACHVTGGAGSGAFMGASAEETRGKFKGAPFNYTTTASRFYVKGEHSGGAAKALSPAQQQLFQQWITAEAGGGAPADAGGGG